MFDKSAGWQSGDAAACKAVNAGSIPASASSKIRDVNHLSLLVGKKVEELFFHRFHRVREGLPFYSHNLRICKDIEHKFLESSDSYLPDMLLG